MSARRHITIVIPVYNEAANLPALHQALQAAAARLSEDCRFLFVDDGSTDGSLAALSLICAVDPRAGVLELSRNFGKEIATTAGLAAATGDAVIMMDADLQHPPELIPTLVAKWHAGAEVVVGVRRHHRASLSKRLNSWLFYKILNSIAETKVNPRATDFRLLDRLVVDEFNRFTERNRMTRGLIDWLGFRRDYAEFDSPGRTGGQATYSLAKLLRLAINSFISLSLFPLRVAGYLGILITLASGSLGLFILVEKHLLHDPWSLHISGTAILADVNMFLIGIVLSSLGLIALYIANIHSEVINRPLYVVRRRPGLRPPALLEVPTPEPQASRLPR